MCNSYENLHVYPCASSDEDFVPSLDVDLSIIPPSHRVLALLNQSLAPAPEGSRRPLSLPLLRRITLRRPSMYSLNLLLQHSIDQSMPLQRTPLSRELRRYDGC